MYITIGHFYLHIPLWFHVSIYLVVIIDWECLLYLFRQVHSFNGDNSLPCNIMLFFFITVEREKISWWNYFERHWNSHWWTAILTSRSIINKTAVFAINGLMFYVHLTNVFISTSDFFLSSRLPIIFHVAEHEDLIPWIEIGSWHMTLKWKYIPLHI